MINKKRFAVLAAICILGLAALAVNEEDAAKRKEAKEEKTVQTAVESNQLGYAENILETDPKKEDSDKDGLTDYEETETYGTDPLSYDVDCDGLSDGDEILLGMDPLKECSDGITPDSERKFWQKVDVQRMDDILLAEENEAVPSLELNIAGNVNRNVRIRENISVEFGESRAVVGEPIEITGKEITEGTLAFAFNEETQLSSDSANTKLICFYETNGATEYLQTSYDTENHCISAEICREGTYFVLDVEELFHELGLELPKELQSEGAAGTASLTAEVAETGLRTSADAGTMASAEVMAPADIVFVIDTTGSMGDEISHVKENAGAFAGALKERGISANLALVTYQDLLFDGEDSTVVQKNGASNWFSDIAAYQEALAGLPLGCGGDLPESALDGLETARLLDMRSSAGKVFVLITDAAYMEENRYGIPSMAEEIELLKNAGIQCTVVSNRADQSVYEELYRETGGSWLDIEGDFHDHLLTIAEDLGNRLVGDGHWIYLQGPVPVPVRLDARPQAGSSTDTDRDGIPDVLELKSVEPSGTIDLDLLLEMVSKGVITDTDYGEVEVYEYESNPTEADTDFDGVEDAYDTAPSDNHGTGIMHYSIDGEYYPVNIEFHMDYRDLITRDNRIYGRSLSMLSALLSTDVYDTSYIEVEEFARTGGSETGTNFGELLGMQDARYLAVNGSDYSEDKDDITDFFVGHKKIIYDGQAHEIIMVSVRGTDGTNEEWSSNFDIGADTAEYYAATGQEHPYWMNKAHHKGFDVAANRVLEKLKVYIEQYVHPNAKKSILITGHSRGAAIANLLGKYFEDQEDYRSYTYTFATPNTTTSADAGLYETIFNVSNTDDIITFMPLESWGFTKYGKTTAICVEDYYENELGAAEEGSWEWFMNNTDYDNDYNTSNTLNAIAKIASAREDFYRLGSTDSEKVWEDDLGHTTLAGAEEELAELTAALEEEKLLKFCNLYIVKDWFIYHVEINYCPAYMLQTLANMTTEVGPLLGRDVAGVYADAKTAFVASSGKVVIGGMTHPHMPPTYYIMTYHDLKSLY